MTRLQLQVGSQFARKINAMPFSDWLAHVDTRIIRKSEGQFSKLDAPQAYWFGLFRLGEDWVSAADEFLQEMGA